jgi:hypothetical protein
MTNWLVLIDTPFKQQRMKAWQPILTPVKVIVIFLIIGIIFVPVGTSLLASSKKVTLDISSLCSRTRTDSALDLREDHHLRWRQHRC